MWNLPFAFLLVLMSACAHKEKPSKKNTPTSYEQDLVTVRTALDQAQMSYLRGCVDAHNKGQKTAFVPCRDKAIKHREELNTIMSQDFVREEGQKD